MFLVCPGIEPGLRDLVSVGLDHGTTAHHIDYKIKLNVYTYYTKNMYGKEKKEKKMNTGKTIKNNNNIYLDVNENL